MIKTCFIILFIFLVSLFFASDNKAAFGLLETNTPGILGAILGGMIAGISIIFSVILSLASIKEAKKTSFDLFINELRFDIKVLLLCLVTSLFLPYLRVTGIPLLTYPHHELLPCRDVFFTALEISTIIISSLITLEVFNVMLIIISHYLNKGDCDNKNGNS